MGYRLGDIAARIGGRLAGDADLMIEGPASIDDAEAGQIAFVDDIRRMEQAQAGRAGALLVNDDFPALDGRNLIHVAKPRVAFLGVLELFVPVTPPARIHPRAVISDGVQLGEGVSIGPCAVLDEETIVGAGTRIHAGAVIGRGVEIGAGCTIGPNVSVQDGVRIGDRCVIHAGATIGGDGFGFEWTGDHHHKVPQLGTVIIEDDVEIGCNSCVDRATLGATRIGRGTKIDNLVQIAHNSRVGRHVILVAQAGLAGSVNIGDGAVLAGQVAVVDHVSVGAGAKIGGQAGVTRDIEAGATVWGTPARPLQRVLHEQASLGRLPAALKQLKVHEARLNRLEEPAAEG